MATIHTFRLEELCLLGVGLGHLFLGPVEDVLDAEHRDNGQRLLAAPELRALNQLQGQAGYSRFRFKEPRDVRNDFIGGKRALTFCGQYKMCQNHRRYKVRCMEQ